MAKSAIIKALANNEISIEVALNRLLIIASDLNNDELSEWAASELHGYSKCSELPSYRKKKSMQFTYSGINGGFQVTNIPFTFYDIIKDHDENAFEVNVMDSVSTLQDFLDNSDTQSYCRDFTYLLLLSALFPGSNQRTGHHDTESGYVYQAYHTESTSG